MIKVLINCAHNESSGGGGYWSYQTMKAISSFANVYVTQEVNEARFLNNPELRFKYTPFDGGDVDYFLDIDFFRNNYHEGAKNIKLVFFPKSPEEVYKYDELVTLSEFTKKWIKNLLGKESVICKPYSKDILPGEKKKGIEVAYSK